MKNSAAEDAEEGDMVEEGAVVGMGVVVEVAVGMAVVVVVADMEEAEEVMVVNEEAGVA